MRDRKKGAEENACQTEFKAVSDGVQFKRGGMAPEYLPALSSCSRVLMTSMGCKSNASVTPPIDPAPFKTGVSARPLYCPDAGVRCGSSAFSRRFRGPVRTRRHRRETRQRQIRCADSGGCGARHRRRRKVQNFAEGVLSLLNCARGSESVPATDFHTGLMTAAFLGASSLFAVAMAAVRMVCVGVAGCEVCKVTMLSRSRI